MRHVFALALALAGFASAASPAAPPEVPDNGPAPAGPACHCAVQAQPTTLAVRAIEREQEDAPRLDALADLGLRVPPSATALERLAGRDQVSPRDAVVPRRGYDATAPPASPLA